MGSFVSWYLSPVIDILFVNSIIIREKYGYDEHTYFFVTVELELYENKINYNNNNYPNNYLKDKLLGILN
ncbi:MAG: hypothetical protein LBC74_12445 [Planctomycetaceae bacterium]|nr:hypothetical protein [Planctomycetaceae bacterium]